MKQRLLSCGAAALLITSVVPPAFAQSHPAEHQHPPAPTTPVAPGQPGHVHAMDGGMDAFAAREASGTAWQPESSPMYGVQAQAGSWQVMLHGNVFAQFLHESGARGEHQAGSINWVMGMARRPAAGGRAGVRAMLSLEPWTVRGCGYPDLLASGEQCRGEPIHDRQHPHDLFMELAAEYTRPLSGSVQWQIYGGLAGEPALGPAAYPHRVSAMPNPVAPIAHHWLDATHITFGVLTTSFFSRKWKAEASVFNGREPDEHRRDLDLAPFDSVSGRVWFMPSPRLALQVSAGHLAEAEGGDHGGLRVDVDRITASATYQRPVTLDWQWAWTVAWGQNREGGESTHAVLLESALMLRETDSFFGRFEVAGKSAHDLDVHDATGVFTVAKMQLGYSAHFAAWRRLAAGFGGAVSLGFVPRSLSATYGRRVNPGLGLFLTLRPTAHRMSH